MIGIWSQIRALARHELRIELSAQETSSLVIPFALAALITIPMAVGLDQPSISRFGFPAFWAISLLFGMQVAWRQASASEPAVRDQVRLAGIDPAAGFAGRALAHLFLVTAFMAATFVAMLFFYSPPPVNNWLALAAAILLFAAGLALLATLIADLTAGWAVRAGLAPLLTAPLLLPLLFAAAQVSETATAEIGSTDPRGILAWLLVLVLIVLIGAIAGVLSARSLEETIG